MTDRLTILALSLAATPLVPALQVAPAGLADDMVTGGGRAAGITETIVSPPPPLSAPVDGGDVQRTAAAERRVARDLERAYRALKVTDGAGAPLGR